MKRNIFPLISSIMLSGLITSCATRFEPGVLNVTVTNESEFVVNDIEIENDGLLYSSPSLVENEEFNASIFLNEDDMLILRYFDQSEGDVEKVIRIPARRSDGGELEIDIFENGLIKPSSRFDLYYE